MIYGYDQIVTNYPMPFALCLLVRQYQITRITEHPIYGPGAGHEKITNDQSNKKIAHLFKQHHPAIAHT